MRTTTLIVLLAAASIAILIPSIAIAQAVGSGWGWMMNTAYKGYSKAATSYWGMMGGMMGTGPWGSGYMGRIVGMGGMVNANYTSITIPGIFIVDEDIEDMEHMAILESNGERYALILPSERWIVRSPNGSTSIVDLDDLRERLNTARVTVKGIYIGSMADMMSTMHGMMGSMMGSYGAPMCHSLQIGNPGAAWPMMPMMGGMGMGMHSRGMGGHGEGDEDHDHMEACMYLMQLPHIVVTEITFNGYTTTPYR